MRSASIWIITVFADFTAGFNWAFWTDREIPQIDQIIQNLHMNYSSHHSGPEQVEVNVPSVSNSFDTTLNETITINKIGFSGRDLCMAIYNQLYHDTTLPAVFY